VQSVEPGALEVGTNRRRAAATGKKEVEAVDSLRPNGQCVLGLQCVGLNGWCAALGICRIWAFSGPTTGSKQGMTQPKTGLPRGVFTFSLPFRKRPSISIFKGPYQWHQSSSS
jgi:hypothetical protein